MVYADWLEERGDPRGAFLRAEVELASASVEERERAELQTRLRAASAAIESGWLAAVSRAPIENCGVSFKFRCPKKWEEIKPTQDESVRYCDGCRQQVFFCSTIELAQTQCGE